MTTRCKCILCHHQQDISLSCCDKIPSSPTNLCKNLKYWKNMYSKCCCTKHKNCFKMLKNNCKCPKCCQCPNPKECPVCSKMNYLYFVCSHQGIGIDEKEQDCENVPCQT